MILVLQQPFDDHKPGDTISMSGRRGRLLIESKIAKEVKAIPEPERAVNMAENAISKRYKSSEKR